MPAPPVFRTTIRRGTTARRGNTVPRGSRRGQLVRLLAAIAAGLMLFTAFPDLNWWWMAPPAVALSAWAVMSMPVRGAALNGLIFGLAFFVPTLSWSGIYVGKLPWFALATLQALYFAGMSAVLGYAGRRLGGAGRPILAWLAVPCVWVAQEWARSTTPFGGFPWARLAFSQADSPVAKVAAYGGAPLVTFVVALVGAALGLAITSMSIGGASRPSQRRWGTALLGLVAAGAFLVMPGLISLPTDGPRARVGLVQGNVPEAGLEFNAERRAVLDNHVRGTETFATIEPSDLSLIVWPENSSDIDPLRNADAGAQIDRALTAAKVPILLGAVLDGPGTDLTNASLFYTGPGATPQRYVKQHPVPFAEYIPYRDFFRFFSDKVDLVTRDFISGTARGAFAVPAPGLPGGYVALPTICFEVAYDGLIRDAVTHADDKPSLLVVQTNNATFGYSSESEQQFAISRIRAIEHGRSVAHVSTVGVSGFINPDGSVTGKTGLFTAAQVSGDPVLRSGLTVADRIGPTPEYLATAGAIVLLARARRSTR